MQIAIVPHLAPFRRPFFSHQDLFGLRASFNHANRPIRVTRNSVGRGSNLGADLSQCLNLARIKIMNDESNGALQ